MQLIENQKLFQLSFLPSVFPVNCYFVEEDDGLTLIDAALPYAAEGICRAAERIGKPITRILLTHAHGDHVGALDSLKQRFPHVQVHISRRDARLLAGDRSLDANEPKSPIRGGVPKPGSIRTNPDVLLEEGDQIGSLLVIATPGHTPGSLSFLDTRTQFIIAGDAFQTRGGFAVAGQLKPKFPFPAMATWNREVALQSAEKILNYAPSLLAVGHGLMLSEPVAWIERAIQHSVKEK